MRLAPFLVFALSLVARTTTAQFGGDEDRYDGPTSTIESSTSTSTPTPSSGWWPIGTSYPTWSPTTAPTSRTVPTNAPTYPNVNPTPYPSRPTYYPVRPTQAPSSGHHCPRYLAHAACRQCVTAKGSLGFTPIADLHFCPTTTTTNKHYDHLGECKPITTPCLSSLSSPITNITSCPNDVAESKPSCGACTADAYVWCQLDSDEHDEYKGICKDASTIFPNRYIAERMLHEREMRDDDDLTIDSIDRLCGPTHTAIISRRQCPRPHKFRTGRLMMAILFHLIPILLCLSACCLCIRAVKKRRQARRTALLEGPVPAATSTTTTTTTTTTTPSAPVSEGVTSISYPANASLPVPLPNGTYIAPQPTAPVSVPMQTFYPTLSAPPASSLRAPLLENQGSINADGLIYAGHVYPNGYSRVQQEI